MKCSALIRTGRAEWAPPVRSAPVPARSLRGSRCAREARSRLYSAPSQAYNSFWICSPLSHSHCLSLFSSHLFFADLCSSPPKFFRTDALTLELHFSLLPFILVQDSFVSLFFLFFFRISYIVLDRLSQIGISCFHFFQVRRWRPAVAFISLPTRCLQVEFPKLLRLLLVTLLERLNELVIDLGSWHSSFLSFWDSACYLVEAFCWTCNRSRFLTSCFSALLLLLCQICMFPLVDE